jgi:hypothetical protein
MVRSNAFIRFSAVISALALVVLIIASLVVLEAVLRWVSGRSGEPMAPSLFWHSSGYNKRDVNN